MNKAAQLLTAVSDIGKEFDEKVRQHTLTVCLFPQKPWHIAQKQAAMRSMTHYLTCKRLGLMGQAEQVRKFNEAVRETNDAIYYHLRVWRNQ